VIVSAKGRVSGGRDWLAGWPNEFAWAVMFQAHLRTEAKVLGVGVGEGAEVIGVVLVGLGWVIPRVAGAAEGASGDANRRGNVMPKEAGAAEKEAGLAWARGVHVGVGVVGRSVWRRALRWALASGGSIPLGVRAMGVLMGSGRWVS
jgi:hypothetical protein